MTSSILFHHEQFSTQTKSIEQIQKLMIPHQTPQLTIIYILTKGHALQLPYVYKNFHLYHQNVLTMVCSKLEQEEPENQITISLSLNTLMQNESIKLTYEENFTIFQAALEGLKNWTTINNQHLIEVIENVLEIEGNKTKILTQMEKTIYLMGKNTQPIISRVIAGRLISIIVKHQDRAIKGLMIDILKKIITSPEPEAKKIWINEIFPKLLDNLHIDFIELHLQQKIYETIYDENEEIGLMALQIVLRNATKFSIEEQGSRIIKLFIDSLTSKNQKIVLMVTSFMGETFQKLQNIIMKNETHCVKFWKSFVEVAHNKNKKIINNFIYNLPGVLFLSRRHLLLDSLCDVYVELFFHPDSDTLLLVSYFHEMVRMFPSKYKALREIIYNLLNEVFSESEPSDESMKIVDCLLLNLHSSKQAFFEEHQKYEERENNLNNKPCFFDSLFNEYLHKYFICCHHKKNGNYLINLYTAIQKCAEYFSPGFTEVTLLPRLYTSIRAKTAYLELVVEIFIMFLARQVSSNNLINNYASKFNVELSKSSKSHEREASMLFFYFASFYFSIETFQEFKMGQKFLQFNSEKNLKNKMLFIRNLPRIVYFLTRQEKIEHQIILNRLRKDPDPEIIIMLEEIDFTENQDRKMEIVKESKAIKEKEKTRGMNTKKILFQTRRETKELKKQDILKKRVDTRSRPKIILKQLPSRKTPMSIPRSNRKNI